MQKRRFWCICYRFYVVKNGSTFPIDFDFHSSGRMIFILVISHTRQIASAPSPPKNCFAATRSLICSDHVRAEHEHRLDGILLEPGPQVLQEQRHCGEEPLVADMRHRYRIERLVTELHCSGVGWDDVPSIPFCNNFDGKWGGYQWRIQREGFGSSRISKRYPNF